MNRKEFIVGATAFAVAPAFARTEAGKPARPLKTPLMLDTKRMAIWDGPGIRTTFFVKGCPLKCIWCHNPESIDPKPQLARFQHLCLNKVKVRGEGEERNDNSIVQPSTSNLQSHRCTMDEATCPTRALKFYGKALTIDDIVAKALEDKAFYEESGGGVTVSGGEPLFFWEWTTELVKRFKAAGLHVCIDTSLYAPPAAIEALLPLADMWLPDYKADDDALHQRLTGVTNRVVRRNLERLVAAKAKLEVRCLVVPGCTDGADIVNRHKYLHSLGISDRQIVDLEYHDYARSKYLALGMKDTMPPIPAKKEG